MDTIMTARVAEVRSRAALAFANKPKPSSQLLPAFHQSKMSLDGSLDYATVQPGQYEAHRAGKIAERTAFMKALGFQDVVPPPPTTTKRAPRAPTPPAKTKETPHRAFVKMSNTTHVASSSSCADCSPSGWSCSSQPQVARGGGDGNGCAAAR